MANPVRIPNPLYEVVFCYLMEDERVARLLAGQGESIEAICQQTGLSEAEVRRWLERGG
ncbi:MAG: helix-turn-helix domain-containing protein [Bacteroidetes bacterium]|nr:MAG: helix-turn-helix domain-containing protein [Bacteroidota bacterium]